jgi:trans-2,3-dihydro-3-hydroxyanthranilate isomerase
VTAHPVSVRFHTVDVFTDQWGTGNPLAVLPDAADLLPAQMLTITREFNYSETAFVQPAGPEDREPTLRIFTPTRELPFAGHPTVGAAAVLAATGHLPLVDGVGTVVFREEIGPVPVTVHREGEVFHAELVAPQLPHIGPVPPSRADLAAMLSLDPEDLAAGSDGPETWSAGVPFTLVPLRDAEVLGRIRFNIAHWERLLADFWAPQVYVFSRAAAAGELRIHARMFSPALGVLEDTGTGAAAIALAGYLATRAAPEDATLKYTIEQGVKAGRRSILHGTAVLAGGTLRQVRLGGDVVKVGKGVMRLPSVELS